MTMFKQLPNQLSSILDAYVCKVERKGPYFSDGCAGVEAGPEEHRVEGPVGEDEPHLGGGRGIGVRMK